MEEAKMLQVCYKKPDLNHHGELWFFNQFQYLNQLTNRES